MTASYSAPSLQSHECSQLRVDIWVTRSTNIIVSGRFSPQALYGHAPTVLMTRVTQLEPKYTKARNVHG